MVVHSKRPEAGPLRRAILKKVKYANAEWKEEGGRREQPKEVFTGESTTMRRRVWKWKGWWRQIYESERSIKAGEAMNRLASCIDEKVSSAETFFRAMVIGGRRIKRRGEVVAAYR